MSGHLDSVCPLLVPQNIEQTIYNGIITSIGNEFRLRIEIPADRNLKNARIDVDWQTRQMLRGCETLCQQRLKQSQDLASFLVEFKCILERQFLANRTNYLVNLPAPSFYSLLISQIEVLGWDRLTFINPHLTCLHLKAEDTRGRSHLLKINLLPQYPQVAPICSAYLPSPFELQWSQNSNLSDVYHQFKQSLNYYQELWDILDDIDQNVWILEPEQPSRADTHRRIALGSNASLQIQIDARKPRRVPDCHFLGADYVISDLKEKFNSQIQKWDPSKSLIENFQILLDIEFPSPSKTSKEELNIECGICYSYRLEDAIPEKACDNIHCDKPFHTACLYEWLRSLTDTRQSFNVLFGQCPYCSTNITVKMTR